MSTASTAKTHDFDVEDVEFLRHGDTPFQARLYKPKGTGPFPIMVDLHGGAWCNQDRTTNTLFAETLARSGVTVVALDWRMPPVAAYPASLADINYGIRWAKSKAESLKGRADRVGIYGVSSGGHQAMLGAMRHADPRYASLKLAGGYDARVACAVLVWPVIDPASRFRHAKRLIAGGGKYPPQIDSVIPSHIKFWGDEAAMEEGNPVGILERGEAVDLPPVLYVQGGTDIVHPRPDLERFVAAYKKRGGDLDLALYEGEGEGFIRNKESKAAPLALERIVAFVKGRLG